MRLFKYIIIISSFVFVGNVKSQGNVGVGTSTPHPDAALEISSETKGLLIPRMVTDSVNAIIAPARGLLVYDSDKHMFVYTDSTSWASVLTSRRAVLRSSEVQEAQTPLYFTSSSNEMTVDSKDFQLVAGLSNEIKIEGISSAKVVAKTSGNFVMGNTAKGNARVKVALFIDGKMVNESIQELAIVEGIEGFQASTNWDIITMQKLAPGKHIVEVRAQKIEGVEVLTGVKDMPSQMTLMVVTK